jgi:serine/threonine protein kinase
MEFFPINLAQLVALCQQRGHRFSHKQVVEWARQLTEGLRELHDGHKLVHRDIKAPNVMFRLAENATWAGNPQSLDDAEAVLTDFGTVASRDDYAQWTVCRTGDDRYKHPDFHPLYSRNERPPRQFCTPEMDIHAHGEILRVLRRLCTGSGT